MSTWGSAQFLGDIAIAPVFDGRAFENPHEVLLRPSFDGDPWAHHGDLLNAEGQLELTMGAYLIRTGDRLILVDAGVGMINNGQYQGGGLLTSLLEFGRKRFPRATGKISIDVKHCLPIVFGEFRRAVRNVADEHRSIVTARDDDDD